MRAAVIIAILLSFVLAATNAWADDEADRKEAKTVFAEGGSLYEADDFVGALAAFRKAHTIRPHDKVRIPIAACLEKLQRVREAIDELENVSKSSEVTEGQRDDATESIERLKLMLGILNVAGAPAGAHVLVDGKLRCQLPCRALVDTGERVVVVRSGVRERNERLIFKPGEEHTIDVSLTSAAPALAPAATPAPSPSNAGPVEPVRETPEPTTRGPGLLTWVGIGVAAVGVAGVIGFGLHANATQENYIAAPSDELRDDGLLARDLSNVSIAVGAAGVVMTLVDLIFLAPTTTSEARFDAHGFRVAF